MAWLSGWSRRKKVTVTGTTAGAQTDFQLKVDVTYDSDMLANFDDLRFTLADGTTLIDFWLESKVDSTSAIVWAEVPSIPANPDTVDIYMYYGKADAASASNGVNTFNFFDDFDGASLDSTKWDNNGAPPIPSNSMIQIAQANTYTKSIMSKAEFLPQSDYEIRQKVKLGTGAEERIFVGFQSAIGASGSYYPCMYAWTTDRLHSYYSSISTAYNFITGVWYYPKIRMSSDYKHYIELADGTKSISTTALALADHHVWFGGSYVDFYVDWVFVRKYASPEPTYGTGSEETPSVPEIRFVTVKVTPVIEILPTIPYIRSLIRKDYGIDGWDRFNL